MSKTNRDIAAITLLSRNPKQLFTEVDDEIVILSIENGEYYNLNDIGSEIWRYLKTPRTFDELTCHLTSIYDIDKETCEIECKAFLTELIEIETVSIIDETGF